jgi:hypothetical protein
MVGRDRFEQFQYWIFRLLLLALFLITIYKILKHEISTLVAPP